MTYQTHYLLAFGGHQGHTEEEWTCNIRLKEYGPDPPGSEPLGQDYLEDTALGALTTWFSSPQTQILTGARLTWMKMNLINPAGHYASSGETNELLGLAIPGGGGTTGAHPLQVACCITWRTTAASRGLGSIGRIFMPRPVVPVDINGDVAHTSRIAIATQTAVLLNTLDVSTGVTSVVRPSIVSRGHAPNFLDEGPANQIDSVEVNSALDVQRRRAYGQSKEISTAPVTY